jgi:hypothetical protein
MYRPYCISIPADTDGTYTRPYASTVTDGDRDRQLQSRRADAPAAEEGSSSSNLEFKRRRGPAEELLLQATLEEKNMRQGNSKRARPHAMIVALP